MRSTAIAAVGLAGALMVAGCTSNPGAELSALAPSASSTIADNPTTPTAPSQEGNTASLPTVPAGTARIAFAPVIGAPTDAVGPLSRELAARAKARGIGVVPAEGGGQNYLMKGYFSTITEGKETTVIYVWDLLDPAGTRLHRIQGQQKATGRGSGWAAVSDATMQAIADQTIDQLATWLASASG